MIYSILIIYKYDTERTICIIPIFHKFYNCTF